MSGATRAIEKRVKIRATAREVWAALTEAEELVRWFPIRASVQPGAGGSISFSWDGSFESTASIEAWEPEKHLVLQRDMVLPGGEPLRIVEDWTIEARGGFTLIYLVHSGFPADESWDAWFDGTRRGWDFELRGLRHYLQRHPGTPREVIWCKREFDGPLDEGWERVMGPQGLVNVGDPASIQNGDRIEIVTASDDPLSGCLQMHGPPLDFAMTVEELNDAYLRLRLDPPGIGSARSTVNLWMSTYGVDAERRRRVQRNFDRLLGAAFPAVGSQP